MFPLLQDGSNLVWSIRLHLLGSDFLQETQLVRSALSAPGLDLGHIAKRQSQTVKTHLDLELAADSSIHCSRSRPNIPNGPFS